MAKSDEERQARIAEIEARLRNPAPCIRSGFCCKKAPCGFGKPIEGGTRCVYLEIEAELSPGVPIHRCGIYDKIRQDPSSVYSPAFGAGCSSTLFNEDRDRIFLVSKGM